MARTLDDIKSNVRLVLSCNHETSNLQDYVEHLVQEAYELDREYKEAKYIVKKDDNGWDCYAVMNKEVNKCVASFWIVGDISDDEAKKDAQDYCDVLNGDLFDE